jgi:hypothetical protein
MNSQDRPCDRGVDFPGCGVNCLFVNIRKRQRKTIAPKTFRYGFTDPFGCARDNRRSHHRSTYPVPRNTVIVQVDA